MKLTLQERQALIGPLVVGALMGIFVAYAAFAFASEYATQGNQTSAWRTALEAALGFFASVLGSVVVLGVIPITVHRLRSRSKPNGSKHE